MSQELPDFERAMVIIPHPDDGEFTAGGSMARWAGEGKEVILVVVTNGAMGSNDPSVEREWLIGTRKEEQQEAASILGIKEVVFLDYEDGYLEDNHDLRRDLIREIRRHKPQVVVSMDPATLYRGGRYVNHTDHRTLGMAFLAALSPGVTTVPLYREELYDKGFEPHRPDVVLLGSNDAPDFYVDISDYIEVKIKAIRAHVSQFGEGGGAGDGMKMLSAYHAQQSGMKGVEHAEAFKALFFSRPWAPPVVPGRARRARGARGSSAGRGRAKPKATASPTAGRSAGRTNSRKKTTSPGAKAARTTGGKAKARTTRRTVSRAKTGSRGRARRKSTRR
ncbi:MAG: PIG-L deacetylase family protein [Acidimicrobiia bacterium]